MLMKHLDSYNEYDIMEAVDDHWLSLFAQLHACSSVGANIVDRLIIINLTIMLLERFSNC
jgi:hypothetical protein